MKKIFAIIIMAVGLISCEKEIQIDLNSADTQIIIEGAITNETGPYYVKLTKTVNFSESNTYPGISDALVIISDNTGVIDTLVETEPGLYKTEHIIGTPGNTYKLLVKTENKVFTATSVMPKPVLLESLQFIPFSTPIAKNGFATLPIFFDPIEMGNSYRFIQTVNGEVNKTYIIANDNSMNGVVNKRPIMTQTSTLASGDNVSIEMRCIDANAYNYFFTLSQVAGDNPSGSTTPSNPPNNIQGDYALGLFTAYTVQTKTQIVP